MYFKKHLLPLCMGFVGSACSYGQVCCVPCSPLFLQGTSSRTGLIESWIEFHLVQWTCQIDHLGLICFVGTIYFGILGHNLEWFKHVTIKQNNWLEVGTKQLKISYYWRLQISINMLVKWLFLCFYFHGGPLLLHSRHWIDFYSQQKRAFSEQSCPEAVSVSILWEWKTTTTPTPKVRWWVSNKYQHVFY